MGFFIIGLFIVVALFPKPLAILAILCLALGDPAACIVGIKFGKDLLLNGKKSLQGSLACFTVCTILTTVVLHAYQVSSDYLLLISLIGGLTATAAELFTPKKLDDNFAIPVITATVLYPVLSLLTDIF